MRVLSLFSGIGAFDLGLERAGMEIVGQVEIEPFCRGALEKHWPHVPRLNDVRELVAVLRPERRLRGRLTPRLRAWRDLVLGGGVDLIAGGVPCQPASAAGKRKGHDDERWLWGEWCRIVRVVRPRWFIPENVRGFLSLPAARGVIRDLEDAGYETWPLLVAARDVGAPHRRERIWIVGRLADAERDGLRGGGRADAVEPHQHRDGQIWPARPGEEQHDWEEPRLVYAGRALRSRRGGAGLPEEAEPATEGSAGHPERTGRSGGVPDANGEQADGTAIARTQCGVGIAESAVGASTHGDARRLARWRRASLKAIGNAVVPQVAEVIGRAVMHCEGRP